MLDTKILVVDDDPNICDLLKLYFENEGYKVKTACDGIEGLAMMRMLPNTIEPLISVLFSSMIILLFRLSSSNFSTAKISRILNPSL